MRHITAINLWEVSLVTFPANPHAGVTAIKNDDLAISIRQLVTTMQAMRRTFERKGQM